MDKDRNASARKQAKGSIKEAIGKVSGATKIQAEGSAEKTTGHAQDRVGGVKGALRNAAKPR